QTKIERFNYEILRLEKAVVSYRRRKQFRILRRYGGWIFWSLIVFTIGLGAVGELIPMWYLRLFLFPLVLWLLALLWERWLEKRDQEWRRRDLRLSIEEFGHTTFWAPLDIAHVQVDE